MCFWCESRSEKVPPTNYGRTDLCTSSAPWLVSHGYRYSIDMQYLAHPFGSYADAADDHPFWLCNSHCHHLLIECWHYLFSEIESFLYCSSAETSCLCEYWPHLNCFLTVILISPLSSIACVYCENLQVVFLVLPLDLPTGAFSVYSR